MFTLDKFKECIKLVTALLASAVLQDGRSEA